MYTKFEYNKDQKGRDKLFGIQEPKTDYISYRGLNVGTLQILLDAKFANPDETQNEAPCVQEIYDFMSKYPEFTAHGYLIGLERDDYRVSIEGVEGEAKSDQALQEFIDIFREADEFEIKITGNRYCRCWYD